MLKKVNPKDPLEIPASTYNAFIDATRTFQQKKGFRNTANVHNTPYLIHNATGKRLPIYSVVMVTGIALELPATADEDTVFNAFVGMPIVFKGEIPDKNSEFFYKICITQEPLEIDGVGKGIVDGLSKCKIKVDDNSAIGVGINSYYLPIDQNTDELRLSAYGFIEDFFHSTSEKVGIANLSRTAMPYFFNVGMTWKSGGDDTTSYTPRLYDLYTNGAIINRDVDVSTGNHPYRRPQDYNVTKATTGLGIMDSNGNVLISWCNEYPQLGTPEVMQ